MGKSTNLSAHEYATAFEDLMRRAVEDEVRKEPTLQGVRTRLSRHSGTLRHVMAEVWDQAPILSEATVTCPRTTVRHADFNDFHLMVRCLGEKFRLRRGRERALSLEETLRRTGNYLPGNPSLTWESLLDALETIPMAFDAEGQPIGYRLEAGVDAIRSLEASAKPSDYDDRAQKIIDQKREEWNDTKRHRRLPR